MGAFGWIEAVFWAVIAGGIVVRLIVVLRRKRGGRQALRSAFGPVVDAGAVQSSAYCWTPSSSLDVAAAYGTPQTGEDDGPGRAI